MSTSGLLNESDSLRLNPDRAGWIGTRLLGRLKIGRRLALGFGLLVVLSLIFGIVAFVTMRIKGAAVKAVLQTENQINTAEDILVEFSLARLNEHQFLLDYPSEGIEAASQEYISLTRQHIATAMELVSNQRTAELGEEDPDPKTLERLDAIDSIMTAYTSGFDQLISTIRQRGLRDSGLEGRLREAVRALENAPAFQDDLELMALLLRIRGHERDWILGQELDGVAAVNDSGAQLKQQFASSGLPGAEAAELRTLVDQYLTEFNSLVELDQQIRQEIDALNQVSLPFTPLLRDIISEEFEEHEDSLAMFRRLEYFSQAANIALQIAILVIGAGSAILVTRSITTPVSHLAAAARRVTAGDLTVQAQIESQDEVAHLAAAFNQLTTRLREVVDNLESQARARTADLTLSIEVGQRAAAIRELDALLPTITDFIKERFDLYYTHIYFVDDIGQNLVIQYGTGSVGQQLMARRHTLPIGSSSIVGRVAATKQSIVVPDTEQSEIHKPNELLPNTRSELAVPLVVEGQVIGVLDMQSDQVNAFSADNLTLFDAMGTQFALSINSAQQWAKAQEAQRKLQETLQQLTGRAWAESLRGRQQRPAFAYDLTTVKPLLTKVQNGDGFSVPVKIQNQTVGKLTVVTPPNRKLSTDEQVLLSSVAHQLAQKAENMRLFEQTQQRASREQLTRQITDKMRQSPDMQSIIQTGISELAKALNVPRAYVKLTTDLTSGIETPDEHEERPDPHGLNGYIQVDPAGENE